jgi:hypothetical protein
MSGKYNIVAEQGATFNLNFTVQTDGVAWNFTGYTARMQVRKSTSSAATLLDLSSSTGAITMTSLGVVGVTVSATTMSTVPAGRWVYDIEFTSPSSEVTRLLEGRFIVSAEVTI